MTSTLEFQPLIIVDERERGNARKVLEQYPCRTQIETLDTGDYLIGPEHAIERKRGDDLTASICDGRFFAQLGKLQRKYAHPMIILESPERMFKRQSMSEASIFGAIMYATYKLHIPIIPTQDAHETGLVLWSMAKKIQQTAPFEYHPEEKQNIPLCITDQMEFLEGLTAVGETRAEQLLDTFHNPAEIFNIIENSETLLNKNQKSTKITGPLAELKGYSAKFIMQNQKLLKTEISHSKLKPFKEI